LCHTARVFITNQEAILKEKYSCLRNVSDERARRLWAASEANAIGFGGISTVARVTGLARSTIHRGLSELELIKAAEVPLLSSRKIRRSGGGRKQITTIYPEITTALESLLEPTRGDLMPPLRWTCKSTRRLSEELTRLGFSIGARKVADLLKALDYSLQANRKTQEGVNHPDRNAQFKNIYATIKEYHRAHQPVISVDTKEKEILGDFSNKSREYGKKGSPVETRTHNFPDKLLGKVVPYGVYDLESNEGWVSVGINHDTARFATNSILRWWEEMGQHRFPRATRLYVTADAGGSNGWRTLLWKVALYDLANTIDMNITVSHFPPGTSKWNKIEHRLFSFISHNWRSKPLYDLQTVVNLICGTTTKTGLIVKSAVDHAFYEKGTMVSDGELKRINIRHHDFHGEWNYTISKCKRGLM